MADHAHMHHIFRWKRLPSLACALALSHALAAEDDFGPPTGFAGHSWGEPLAAFQDLKLLNANTVSNSPGITTFLPCRDTAEPCDDPNRPDLLMQNAKSQIAEGAGSFAVSEYYREPEQNPWAESLVALNAITYMFCAEWRMPTIPSDIRDKLRYCGSRMVYRSDTSAQLITRRRDYKSNHDRLLRHLIQLHGPPDGYRYKQGNVSVGPIEDSEPDVEPTEAADAVEESQTRAPGSRPELQRYRWCGLAENANAVLPRCAATVTLMFDEARGWGFVLYATGGIYNFAYGRHVMQDENNELYVTLSGRDPDKPFRKQVGECRKTTGSLVCAPGMRRLRDADIRKFEPTATAAHNRPQ
jgi:hypothetical protein